MADVSERLQPDAVAELLNWNRRVRTCALCPSPTTVTNGVNASRAGIEAAAGVSAAAICAWIAFTSSIAPEPLLMAGAVLCWTGGFDVIYATADFEHDRAHGVRAVRHERVAGGRRRQLRRRR